MYLYNYNNNDYCQIGSPFYGHNRIVEKVNSLSDKQFGLVFQKDFNDKINGKCILTIDDSANPTKIVCEYKGKTYSFLKLKRELRYINRVIFLALIEMIWGKHIVLVKMKMPIGLTKLLNTKYIRMQFGLLMIISLMTIIKILFIIVTNGKIKILYIYNGHSEGRVKFSKMIYCST